MERGQLGPRIDAELLREQPAALTEDGQRVGLAAEPVEDGHVLAAQPLVGGMAADQRGQLRHQLGVASEGQVGVEPVGGRRQPQVLQPGRLPGQRRVAQPGQGGPPPQRQRRAEQLGGLRGRLALRASASRPANRSASSEPGGIRAR